MTAATPLRKSRLARTAAYTASRSALSVEVTDWLTLGLGAQIQFIDLRLTDQSTPSTPVIDQIDGDDFGFGLTAGVLITPMPGTEIGLGYRSFINHDLDGEVTIDGVSADSSLAISTARHVILASASGSPTAPRHGRCGMVELEPLQEAT